MQRLKVAQWAGAPLLDVSASRAHVLTCHVSFCFGKEAQPLHLASRGDALSAPPLPRAIEGIATRLTTTQHPSSPHLCARPMARRARLHPVHYHQRREDGT